MDSVEQLSTLYFSSINRDRGCSRRGNTLNPGCAQAGPENESAARQVDPQQQRHDPAEDPVDGVQRCKVFEVDDEQSLGHLQKYSSEGGGDPDFGQSGRAARSQFVEQG